MSFEIYEIKKNRYGIKADDKIYNTALDGRVFKSRLQALTYIYSNLLA